VNIAQINLNGVNLIAKVDVGNPNRFPIPLPKIDWELFVNSASFIQGVVSNDASIRSMETVTLDIPMSFTFDGLFRSFTSLIGANEFAYNIAMGLSFPIPVIDNRVFNLDFSGVLPLPQLPRMSSASVRVANVDYSGLVLASTINVENPNVFPISFPEIDWDLGVNGVSAIKSREQSAELIPAHAAAAADINMNISFADLLPVADFARNRNEIASTLLLTTALPFDAPFEADNVLNIPVTISMPQKPEVSFQGITRRALGRTMELVLNWEVINRNNFDFEINEFNYDFLVNNRSWAQGRALNLPTVRAGSRTLIPVAISISAPPIVAEIADIINRGVAVNYLATGNMSFSSGMPGLDIPDFPLNLQGNTRIR
jgi:LEA14-like dessication related protein